jgi:hypothetical protein
MGPVVGAFWHGAHGTFASVECDQTPLFWQCRVEEVTYHPLPPRGRRTRSRKRVFILEEHRGKRYGRCQFQSSVRTLKRTSGRLFLFFSGPTMDHLARAAGFELS